MAVNFQNSQRPAAREAKTREFTDAVGIFSVTVRRPGQVERCSSLDKANDLIRRFLGTDTTPGIGWPPIGGQAADVSPTMIQNAALYAAMQPDDAPERYSTEEWVAMQVVLADETWLAVNAFLAEVMQSKNPSRSGAADTSSPSESASGTQSDTPS